jgi:hypothetical protein
MADATNRGTMVSVRFLAGEYDMIRDTAERSGRTVSSYIRDAVIRSAEMGPKPVIMIGTPNGAGGEQSTGCTVTFTGSFAGAPAG